MDLDKEIKENLMYDHKTGDLWWLKDKRGRDLSKPAGGVDSQGYRVVSISSARALKAHRVSWYLYFGKWPTQNIDHIDRNRSNNKIENLRECTQSENMFNVGTKSDNTSGAKGVNYNREKNKWVARIRYNGKRIHLGYFNCPTLATIAYDRAAIDLHGEFASPNLLKT